MSPFTPGVPEHGSREASGSPLHLWCDGAHDAPENMRRDAALLERLERAEDGERAPVLRLFAFEPPGITLGRAQRPERDLDLERCRAEGVAWAVRPTGGRAIFHDREWTFSFAAAIADPVWGGTLAQAYAAVSRLIAASLARLGVPAELASRRHAPAATRRPAEAPFPRTPASAACFASTARHEIVLGGRKLAGCAQRRTATALLQQGSVLLGEGHLRLADYLAIPEARRAAMREDLRAAAASAAPFLGGDARLERWADAIAAELGPRARRIDGDAGTRLLTLMKGRSYTSPVSESSTRPGIAGRSSHA